MNEKPAMSPEKQHVRQSPIESLPTELLSAIFKTGQQLCVSSTNVDPLPFQFLISSVNRHWRSVALGYHDLWSDIDVSFQAPIQYTRLWFERSRPCKVNVTLDINKRGHKAFNELRSDPDKAPAFRAIFGDAADRLGRLTIRSYMTADAAQVFDSIGHSVFSHLSQLRLSARFYSNEIPGHPLPLLAPSLQTIQLSRIQLAFLPSFSSLKRLDIRHTFTNPLQFRDLMSSSPGLTHLTLSGPPYIEEEQVSGTIIHAPSLRFVAFTTTGHLGRRCSCVISYLSMPNLEYLEIFGFHPMASENLMHFHVQTPDTPRFPKLHTLRLDGVPLTAVDLLTTHFPMVTNLLLSQASELHHLLAKRDDDNSGIPPLMKSKSVFDSSSCRFLWPHLKVVTFLGLLPSDTTMFHLALSDRIEAGVPLHKIRLPRGLEEQAGLWKGSVEVEIFRPDAEPSLLLMNESEDSDFEASDSDENDYFSDDTDESYLYYSDSEAAFDEDLIEALELDPFEPHDDDDDDDIEI